MRTIIVGGVAGGMSAATRLRRLDENMEIIVIERGSHVSFANCGLPYYVGGVIEEQESLLLQSPEGLQARFRLDVRVRHEVLAIHPDANSVEVRDINEDITYSLEYDNLILSMGASPIVPPIEGSESILTLRSVDDALHVRGKIDELDSSAHIVVVGAGFIGVEMVENLAHTRKNVTIVELADQVLSPLEYEMASYVQDELQKYGVSVRTGVSIEKISGGKAYLSDGDCIQADIVVGSIGVRPESRLANEAGLIIGERGGVIVDESMRTNKHNIYAVGDMVEKLDRTTRGQVLVALANLANKQGRRAADAIAGVAPDAVAHHSIGVAVVQVFDLTVAMVGVNKKILDSHGLDYATIHLHPNNHVGYYPGAQALHSVVHFNPETQEIYGAQFVGATESARKADVISAAMFAGLKITDLIDLEMAYSPQHGSAKDVINMIGYIAEGIVLDLDKMIHPDDLDEHIVIDVRTAEEFGQNTIPGSINVPIDEMRGRLDEIMQAAGDGRKIVVTCLSGQRGHSACRYLTQFGLDVANLSGGNETWQRSRSVISKEN